MGDFGPNLSQSTHDKLFDAISKLASGIIPTSVGLKFQGSDTGNVDFSGSSGTLTAPTGGIVQASPYSIFWSGGLAPGVGTIGNNTSPSAGAQYWAQVYIPDSCTITGIQPLIGTTGGTDRWIVGLANSAGTIVAQSMATGTTVSSSANTLQGIPFTAPYSAVGPANYYLALQSNSTTATFQSHTIVGNNIITGSAAGTFGTFPAITPGRTYNNNVGPIGSTY